MKKKLLYLIPIIAFLGLLAIFVVDIVNIWPQLTSGSEQAVEEALSQLGFRGGLVLALIQTMQVLIVFIPCEFVQIVSGVTYGIWWGSLVCWVGIILGATIIYMLVNLFKVKNDSIKNSSAYDTIELLSHKKSSVSKLVLILFFLPAIPYGMICYYAAGNNLSYWRYILLVIIGVAPSVVVDTIMGKAFIALISKYMGWVIVGILVMTIAVMLIVNTISKRKMNKMLYGEPNPSFATIMATRKARQPDAYTYDLCRSFFGKRIIKRNRVVLLNDEIKDIKEPCLILSTHPSWPDFMYCALSMPHIRYNAVVNYSLFYNSFYRRIFEKLGVIPKKMYTPDSRAIKDMLSVARNGGSIMMMPAGRLSINGTQPDMPAGLDKLIKKLELPVVTIRPHGAYLTRAKWMKSKRRGRVEVECHLTLTKDEIINNDVDYIRNKIEPALEFDDFAWNDDAHVYFKGKNLCKGVEGILYICPHCHSEYTLRGEKNTIVCDNCHNVVTMDNYYNFTNPPTDEIKNIRDWYNYQVGVERERISKPDYTLVTDVTVKTYTHNGRGMCLAGEGTCRLTHEGVNYKGSFNDEQEEWTVAPKDLQALLFSCNEDFELYHDNKFYYFQPKQNRLQCVQWAMVSELLHNYHRDDSHKNDE